MPSSRVLDRRDWLVLFLLLVGILLAYFTVLLSHYGFLDDYFWLDLSSRDPHEVFARQAVGGRPINGLLLPWIFRLTATIDHLVWVRALVLVELAVMAWMLYLALRRATNDPLACGLLAGLACTVPAIQVYAVWATSVTVPLSGILAIAAAMFVAQPIRQPKIALAILLLFLSAITYQPTAMIFWPVAAIDLFSKDRRPLLLRAATYLTVAGIALFFAWLVYRWGLAVFPQRPSPQRDQLTGSPAAKILWFFRHPLVDSLNLWNIRPNLWIACGMAAFLIVGLLCYFPGPLSRRLSAITIAAALLPLSYLPNLLVQENWSSYRTQIGLVWLILILAWLAIDGLFAGRWRGVRVALFGLVMEAGLIPVTQYQVTRFFVLPQTFELDEFRTLIEVQAKNATHIILLQPDATSPAAPYSRYDEFGRTSLREFWVPQSEVNLIRREIDPHLPPIDVELVPDFVGPWTRPVAPGTVVIDMRMAFAKN